MTYCEHDIAAHARYSVLPDVVTTRLKLLSPGDMKETVEAVTHVATTVQDPEKALSAILILLAGSDVEVHKTLVEKREKAQAGLLTS